VRCRLPGFTKAALQPGGASLPLEQTNDGIQITVPVLDMHAMVVFE
jgi:hypothetical protein